MRITVGALFLWITHSVALRPGNLPESFVEPLPNPPPWQVHAYNNNTYILRQSGFTDYEKPFLYLLFGNESAYLLDTGSLYVYRFSGLPLTFTKLIQYQKNENTDACNFIAEMESQPQLSGKSSKNT